jgi:hypothetical protein
MSMSTTLSRSERLRQQIEQKRAELARVEARDRQRERKLDDRRKIILGGALISLARKNPTGPVADAIRVAIATLERPRDQEAFANWSILNAPEDDLGLVDQPSSDFVPTDKTSTQIKADETSDPTWRPDR